MEEQERLFKNFFFTIKKPCHCFEMLPRAFLCPACLCLSVCVRRWLWKLAGLCNREEPRVIKKRANDCLSIEYFPGKKCRGVKGEKKIWTPDMLCIPRAPHRCPQAPRQSLALLLGLHGQSWGTSYAVKGYPNWKCFAKCCVMFAEMSHPEWDAGERRVLAGLTALLNTQLGNAMGGLDAEMDCWKQILKSLLWNACFAANRS